MPEVVPKHVVALIFVSGGQCEAWNDPFDGKLVYMWQVPLCVGVKHDIQEDPVIHHELEGHGRGIGGPIKPGLVVTCMEVFGIQYQPEVQSIPMP